MTTSHTRLEWQTVSLGDLPVCTAQFGITNSLPLGDQTEVLMLWGASTLPTVPSLQTLDLALFTGTPLTPQHKGNLGLLFLGFLSKGSSKCASEAVCGAGLHGVEVSRITVCHVFLHGSSISEAPPHGHTLANAVIEYFNVKMPHIVCPPSCGQSSGLFPVWSSYEMTACLLPSSSLLIHTEFQVWR